MSAKNLLSTPYYAGLANNELVGTKCQKCGNVHYPPRPICEKCRSSEMEEIKFSGKGALEAYSVVYIASTAMIEAGYGRKNPHCAGIVRLEEGPAVSAQILGVDVSAPESIKIGTPMTAAFVERGEEEKVTYLAFQA